MLVGSPPKHGLDNVHIAYAIFSQIFLLLLAFSAIALFWMFHPSESLEEVGSPIISSSWSKFSSTSFIVGGRSFSSPSSSGSSGWSRVPRSSSLVSSVSAGMQLRIHLHRRCFQRFLLKLCSNVWISCDIVIASWRLEFFFLPCPFVQRFKQMRIFSPYRDVSRSIPPGQFQDVQFSIFLGCFQIVVRCNTNGLMSRLTSEQCH